MCNVTHNCVIVKKKNYTNSWMKSSWMARNESSLSWIDFLEISNLAKNFEAYFFSGHSISSNEIRTLYLIHCKLFHICSGYQFINNYILNLNGFIFNRLWWLTKKNTEMSNTIKPAADVRSGLSAPENQFFSKI